MLQEHDDGPDEFAADEDAMPTFSIGLSDCEDGTVRHNVGSLLGRTIGNQAFFDHARRIHKRDNTAGSVDAQVRVNKGIARDQEG
jgi:hypothetical protein